MRTLGTILAAVIVSGFVAGMLQVQLGIFFNAQEEFIAVMMGQTILVLVAAAVLGATFAVTWSSRAISRAAAATIALFIAALVTLEALALTTSAHATGQLPSALSKDVPILVEIGVPGVLAIFIQWWLLRQYANRRARRATAAA